MSSVKILNQKGASVGTIDLPASPLAGTAKGAQAMHDVVVAYQNGLRAGTASVKTKATAAGSGKKPWKQKGTGRARAGYRRSPVWKGGGVAFGPVPRSYLQRLPKKVTQLAFRRAFSDKVESGALVLLDSLVLEAPKTKLFAAIMKDLGLKGATLFILDKVDPKVLLALRNLPGVALATAAECNTFELMKAEHVVATQAAMEILKRRLTVEGSKAS